MDRRAKSGNSLVPINKETVIKNDQIHKRGHVWINDDNMS